MIKRASQCLVVAATALTFASPALACDLHGPGQLGGFHRYNPFASAMSDFPELPKAPQEQAESDDKSEKASKKDDKAKKEDKRRQDALEETPKREWERDYGNGAITEADKATFT